MTLGIVLQQGPRREVLMSESPLYLEGADDRHDAVAHFVKTTKGPMWGHPVPVLGAISPLLEPFCGHLSPKIDKVS